MKKFFAALTVIVLLLIVNVSYAAEKLPALTDIDAENFYRNLGYEVDCSYWDRTRDGRLLFEAMIPEDPLVIAKDFGNIEVYTDKKWRIVELRLYMRKVKDNAALTATVAKAIKALDAETFNANQAAIEQGILQFISTPQLPDDGILTVTADKKFALHKEEMRGRILAVHITAT